MPEQVLYGLTRGTYSVAFPDFRKCRHERSVLHHQFFKAVWCNSKISQKLPWNIRKLKSFNIQRYFFLVSLLNCIYRNGYPHSYLWILFNLRKPHFKCPMWVYHSLQTNSKDPPKRDYWLKEWKLLHYLGALIWFLQYHWHYISTW